jgi:3-hydroxyisobutyrate dehydrogenase-like beta-hydroxyacid dehydrogenase
MSIQAVGEALLFASKAGADPARVRQALMGGFASSKFLEVHGERMVKWSFEPGFRMALHQKNLNLALGYPIPPTARSCSMPVPPKVGHRSNKLSTSIIRSLPRTSRS